MPASVTVQIASGRSSVRRLGNETGTEWEGLGTRLYIKHVLSFATGSYRTGWADSDVQILLPHGNGEVLNKHQLNVQFQHGCHLLCLQMQGISKCRNALQASKVRDLCLDPHSQAVVRAISPFTNDLRMILCSAVLESMHWAEKLQYCSHLAVFICLTKTSTARFQWKPCSSNSHRPLKMAVALSINVLVLLGN